MDYTVQSATDYYPYGKALRTYGKERYQSTYHERDVESGFDYRGARFYDGETVRFNSLDPLAAEFPSWSPFNYVLGNPNIYIDPDGRAPDNVGVDKEGNVVFDDGKDDGNLFLVNDDTKKVENLEQLKENSTQLTKEHVWVASDEQLIDYVKSQWEQSGNGLPTLIHVLDIEIDNSKYGFSVNVVTGKKDAEGNIMETSKSPVDYSFKILYKKGKENHHLSNPYNTRNGLGHEKQHIRQALRLHHAQKWIKYDKAAKELDAIKVQRSLPSWSKTTSWFKQSVKIYENKWKK